MLSTLTDWALTPIKAKVQPTLIRARAGLYIALIIAFFTLILTIVSHVTIMSKGETVRELGRAAIHNRMGQPIGYVNVISSS